MNFPKKALLGSLLALSATSAFAVDTADLRVIGTIAPTACTPTFAGGATVDYGLIPSASLSRTDATNVGVKTINYAISCDAPISIGTSWVDGRTATTYRAGFFGLGEHAGAPIGYYVLQQVSANVTADGNAVSLIQRNTPASAWVLSTTAAQETTGVRIYSYAPTGTIVPGAYSNYAGTMSVTAYVAPTSTLDMSRSIALDGLATMVVRYL